MKPRCKKRNLKGLDSNAGNAKYFTLAVMVIPL
jgi:hypothetical protein